MRAWTVLALLGMAGSVYAQDKPAPKPGPQEEEHDELTPEKAMQLLKEVQDLMVKSEELLNDSARGRAVETEEAILKRIHDLLKDDPSASQKKTLEKIEKLMEKSQGQQKDAVEKMAEIIKKAKT